MSSALDSLQQIADKIDAAIATFQITVQAVTEKINAVDPKDPTALEQIAAIQAEYKAARDTYVGIVKPAFDEMQTIINGLPADEKNAGQKIFNDVSTRNNISTEKAAAYTATKDTKKAEAQAAVDAKNKEVEDNAAKTPEQTDQQNKQYVASGAANDDKGGPTQTNSNIPVASKLGTSNTLLPHGSSIVFDPITITGKKLPKEELPGRRLENPLGNFSSYTYQLSLYMITPDAYTAFMNSNRTDINTKPAFDNSNRAGGGGGISGAFLIAQSGGINSTEKRAPGFEDVDFFIDDLKITQAISGQDTGTDTNVTTMSFNIYEPYGFSLVTRMRNASNALAAATASANYKDVQNPSRQFFILGIQFTGYDESGNLIDPSKIPNAEGDPSANAKGLFKRYYDITITKLKFKIDGKMVTYNIEAASTPNGVVFGQKNGVIWHETTLIGETVHDVLTGGSTAGTKPGGETASSTPVQGKKGTFGLIAKLNKDQQLAVENGSIGIANEYDVQFLGDADFLINEASIISKADLDKRKWSMTPEVTDASKSNESNSVSGVTVPNPNLKELKIATGTPILQAINAIVTQSEFMESRLRKVYQSTTQPDPKKKEFLFEKNEKKIDIQWFNIGTQVDIKGWDKKQGDWAYKIKYIIQLYDTPVVVSAYDIQTRPYYGPQKRYNYWFTGKNTEILRYEQQMDNSYYVVALDTSDVPSTAQAGPNDVPIKQGQPNNQPTQGRLDIGLEAQNSYLTSLYDPSAYATAKIQILGDPDFLMQASPTSITQLYHQFYGTDGFSISPNGGQTFIEVNFNEPKDYDNSKGTLSINDSIYFWRYPKQVQAELDGRGGGVIYQVRTCTSTFSKGKFIQDLECNLATFGDPVESTDSGRAANPMSQDPAQRAGQGSSTTSSTGVGSTSNTGFGISPPSTFMDPAQLGQAARDSATSAASGALGGLTSGIANAASGTMGTIKTALGQVADGDKG